MRRSISRLQAAGILLAAVVGSGIIGFVAIENLGPLDAVYQTVITISTLGTAEPEGGLTSSGKILTVYLVVVGVGTVFYTATISIEHGLEQFLGGEGRRRRMAKQIGALRDHVIICGFGLVGEGVAERVRDEPDAPDLCVVESHPDRVADAREDGLLVVEGDATHDEALLRAGIERARSLVTCVRSDSDNLAIVLSAKARRPDLTVIARATEAESTRKLRLAGADRVVAPQLVGANRLAALAMQPELVEFVDLTFRERMLEMRIEQFEVVAGTRVANHSLRDSGIRDRSGALVLAVEHPDGRTWLNPGPEFVVRPGHVIFGIGTEDQVDALGRLVSLPV